MSFDIIDHYDYICKAIVVGDSGVGKSSLVQSYVNNVFTDHYISTIGVDFLTKSIKKDDSIIKLQLWDTAGQERFRPIVNSYYRGTNVIILVYDCTNLESFENLQMWYEEIKNFINKTTPILILSNKNDIIDKKIVTYDQGYNYAQCINAQFAEVSANVNIANNKILIET